jgi:hypothetical protein
MCSIHAPCYDENHDRLVAEQERIRSRRSLLWLICAVGVLLVAYVAAHLVLHLS